MRLAQGLDDVIGYTVVDWYLAEGGWRFTDKVERCEPDPIHNKQFLREYYLLSDPEYQGNITVPVLFDKVRRARLGCSGSHPSPAWLTPLQRCRHSSGPRGGRR